jgi:hypothetical protein
VISGTGFMIASPSALVDSCAHLPEAIAGAFEIAEIRAECELGKVMCLSCEDGIVAIELSALDTTLELFVRLAVASRHGAFARQLSALLAIASELGANTLAFKSRRRGWARRLGPEWSLRGTDEFVRQVQ